MPVVYGEEPAAWIKLDETILRWCHGVREEITRDWEQKVSPSRRAPPMLKIEPQSPERSSTIVKSKYGIDSHRNVILVA
jgi:hypothetical protein